MTSAKEVASLVIVGALWGCTNPLLRRGSMDGIVREREGTSNAGEDPIDQGRTASSGRVLSTLARFRSAKVWLPYALNQLGSVLFYISLPKSEMSLVVPISNGLALLFSIATSFALGERLDQPIRTLLGAAMVMGGVSLCLLSRNQQQA